MSEQQPWTIERICDALGSPALTQRFLGEINKAPAHMLLHVFSKWQGIAERSIDAAHRGREIAAAEERGEEPPGQWTDITERVLAEATRNRSHGAA